MWCVCAAQGYKIFVAVVLGLYLLYLVYLLVRACTELRSMPYFGAALIFRLLDCSLLILVVIYLLVILQ